MMIMSSGALLTRSGEGPVEASYNTFGFDGSSESVSATISGGLGDSTNSTFTQSVWFNADLVPSWTHVIVVDDTGTNGNWIGVRLDNSTTIKANLYNGTTNEDVTGSFTTGSLVNATITYDYNTGNMELFVNGSSQGTITTTGSFSNLTRLNLGRTSPSRSGGLINWYDGSLANAMVWNRVLSNSEISNLYNAGKIPYYETLPASLTSGNVLALELSSRDDSANDLSGNGNNGTKNGGVSADGSTQTFASYS
jgi:hypothetical protein